MQVLLSKLCRKLDAEARFRPTRLQLVWPFRAAEVHVATCLAAQAQCCHATGTKRRGSQPSGGRAAVERAGASGSDWDSDPMIRAEDGSHTMQLQVCTCACNGSATRVALDRSGAT